jgi:hypothetical protein
MAKKTIQRSSMTQTDSRGKVIRSPIDTSAETAVNFRWWQSDDERMAFDIAGTIKFIQLHQGSRMEQLTVSTRLYGQSTAYNLIGTAFTRKSSVNSNPASQRISYNVVESIIDTLESKMAKNKVIPTYVTNGGMWNLQKKAKDLTKFTQGLFYQEKVHSKSIVCWSDSAVWGDGFLHIFEKHDKLCIERTLPHEIFVDTIETLTGPPQQLHRVKIMDRDIALELLPELEEHIMTVAPANYQEIGGQGTAVDLITVTESWHLKSGPDAKDGVHVFCVGDGSLVEDYEDDYFPFCHLRYARRKFGYYGQGVPERIQNIQGELNRCMILKQRALWMQCAFKILIENGSKVVSQHLNNDVGSIIHYTGTPPQYVTPPATNPELQAWIDALITYALQQEGISRMSTTGEAPMGVESGKALRTLVQVSDDRFMFMSQELEDFTLEIARQSIEVIRKIYARKKTYEVVFPDTQFMDTIDWKDINLQESQYTLQAFPTSSLSDDLTGRLAEIQELAQAGYIDPVTSFALLEMPDLEKTSGLQNAPYNLLCKLYDQMLHDKKQARFEPGFHNAQLAQKLGLQYINYAEQNNCPEENIQLARDFVNSINAEALTPTPGVVAPGAPQAQPTANPTATPTNNMIPNAAGAQGAPLQ